MEIEKYIEELCIKTKAAAPSLALAGEGQKNAALSAIASLLSSSKEEIIAANSLDLAHAEENGVPKTMLDRLALDSDRIDKIADSVREIIALPDPCGKGERWSRPNGLTVSKIRVPLGVCAIIYEARPNVTYDAAALCIKSGNAVILRGGKEAIESNRAALRLMKKALSQCGIDPDSVALVDDTSRKGTEILMTMRKYIDVLIPRGGKGLIKSVVENSKIPTIETGAGNCHMYIDSKCDLETALSVSVSAKISRPSVCNSIETLLVHSAAAEIFLPRFYEKCVENNVEIRGCEKTLKILPGVKAATEEDWSTEYNDYIISVRVVKDIDEAINHINRYNTGHSEAIITNDYDNARLFQSRVDAAAVYVNASTRYTDGGEFGFGAEIGISTQKLHARGPMGLPELTTVKYLIDGCGQIR